MPSFPRLLRVLSNPPVLGTAFSSTLLLLSCGVSAAATVNQPPTATSVTVTTKEDSKAAITLKGVDPEKKKLTYALVSQPSHGTVVLAGSKATYVPAANYFNTATTPDSFTFKVNDGTQDSVPATVKVVVTSVNDVPTAQNASASTVQDTAVDIALIGADVEGDPLTYVPSKSKKGGTVVVKSGNTVTYTPKKGYLGADSFTFTAKDSNKGVSKAATVSITVTAKTQNLPPTANAGIDQTVNEQTATMLDGSASKDSDGTIASYLWKQTAGTTVGLAGATTAKPTFTTPDVATDTSLTFELLVTDNKGATAKDTVNILVKAATGPVVQPTPTGMLNDTGITKCGNGTANNLTCPQASYPGQDAEYGRDANQATNNDYDGHAGFSYAKISNSGQALPVTATQWGCVKDNVTGLIWEIKQGTPNNLTGDTGLHDPDDGYTWYEPDNSKNGGFVGYQQPSDSNASNADNICYGHAAGNVATYCNTKAYVNRVNAAGWCGANDWRMPTITELQSILSRDRFNPAIDTTWFPNMPASTFYWSSSPMAGSSSPGVAAWYIPFSYGQTSSYYIKSSRFKIRLVRGTN